MKPERWTRMRPILEAAWALPPAEREAHVRAACGDDTGLADDILAQLAAEADDPTFLEPPVTDAPAELAASIDVGTQLGPWRVTRRLAQGGMGTVWEAERDDGAFTMVAAVKVLRDGLTTDALRRRFHDERELLARLDHPSIVRLLDGGTHDGLLPYLVMERVDGTAIDAWCDERRLGVDARLRLLLDVYDAVASAHGALVVHRDIKPSNVLVDTDGRPRLLDFGISTSATSGDDGTLASSPLTPRYASPEQLRDEPVTTASDVFALGVLSFELLVGATPHGDGPRDAEAEAARASDVARRAPDADERAGRRSTKPAALTRRLSGDLDAVLARALAVDAGERYATVAALRDDVRRHMRHEVVSARRAGPGLVLARLVHRHPIASSAVGLAAGVLVAATVIVTKQYVEAEDARAAAEASAAVAERRLDDVHELASALVFDLHDEIAAIPGATRARAALVDTSLRYLDALADEAGDDDALLADVAGAYRRLGDVQGAPTGASLGDPTAARAAYERLVDLRAGLLTRSDPADRTAATVALVEARRRLASVLERQGALDEAFAQLDAADEELDAVGGDAAVGDLGRADLGVTIDRGDALARAGRVDEAAVLLETARPRALTAAHRTPPDAPERADLDALLDVLGNALQRSGRVDEAVERLTEALDLARARAAALPGSASAARGLAVSEQSLADALVYAGRVDEALGHHATALAAFRDLVEADPADGRARRDLHRHLAGMARALLDAGRRDDALACWDGALTTATALVDRRPDDIESLRDAAQYAVDLGGVLWRSGRHDESRTRDEQALELVAGVLAVDPTDRVARQLHVSALHNLAISAFLTGDPQRALEHAEASVARIEPLADETPSERWPNRMVMVCRTMVGDAQLALARGAEAPRARASRAAAAVEAYESALAARDTLDARGLLLADDAEAVTFVEQGLADARALLDEIGEP